MRNDVAAALKIFNVPEIKNMADIENAEKFLFQDEQVLFISSVICNIISTDIKKEGLSGIAILTSKRFIFYYNTVAGAFAEAVLLDEIRSVNCNGNYKKGCYLEILTFEKTYYILLYYKQKMIQYIQDLFAWAKNNKDTNNFVPNQTNMQIQQPLQENATISSNFLHKSGLPVAEKAECQLLSYPDRYDFFFRKMKFSLVKNKVIDVCCKDETQFQQQYASSAGGAVAGAMLFGPVGAMVGGRTKKKTDMIIRHYLIITYVTDNEVKNIVLENTGISNKTNKFVIEFNANRPVTTNIEL